ncbi:mucin-1 [Eurosta solidaginis]|uniref:mucin-1 n=1 Tax=Eurosta solidaginis TaxID=178769 RepID=UPI0035313F59
MFNKQTQQHQQAQLLNPFSSASGRASPKPTFSKDEYGKPLAGSITEMRGQKANMHVLREMLELCQIIDSEGYDVKDDPKMRVIPFGELFNIYNYISDKVVGILLRARKHKLVEFEGEMLFQRRDDDVPIFLLKPIVEIRQELNAKIEDIKRGGSPAPQATSLLLDKSAHKQKLASGASTPTASPAPSKQATPAHSKASTPVHSKASSPVPSKASSPVQSKASSPTPADALKLQQTSATASAQQHAEVNQQTQPTPEVTITAAPDEVLEHFARLEGGQEAKPIQNSIETTSDVSATVIETELNINQLTAPEFEHVPVEHIEPPVPIGADSNTATNEHIVDIPTTAIDNAAVHTRGVLGVPTETIAIAPTLVEASTDAALKETDTSNAEAYPQA